MQPLLGEMLTEALQVGIFNEFHALIRKNQTVGNTVHKLSHNLVHVSASN